MVSVLLPALRLYLQISRLGEFVIFYDIRFSKTCFGEDCLDKSVIWDIENFGFHPMHFNRINDGK